MAKKPMMPQWPGATLWKLDEIRPYPKNARTHPQAQIDLLAEILKKFGPDQPIVVDEDGVILKGHGRRLGALQAAMKTFPVVQRFGLPEEDKYVMRIGDNQVALLAGWDRELIRMDAERLKLGDYGISLLGFSEAQRRGMGLDGTILQTQDPELIPEPPKKPVVQVGDVWICDHHRIVCGDATSPTTWKTLFGSDRAAMIFTDPPYGVSYTNGKFDVIQGDHKRRDDLYKMFVASLREMTKHANDRAAFYIWHADWTREDFSDAMKAAGLVERQHLLWVKPAFAFGHSDYQWQHEPCFYASKADQKPAFYGQRAESTVWHAQLATAKDIAVTIGSGLILLDGEGGTLFVQSRAPKNKKLRQIRITKDGNVFLSGADRQDGTVWEVARDGAHEHPTQKPVELARRAIENSSQPGEIVADGFLGSFTTGIACEMTGRRCFGVEIDPIYAEVGIKRWEKFTGGQATLNGKTFDRVAEERRPKVSRVRRDARQDAERASSKSG